MGLSLGLSSTAQVLPMLQSGGNLRTPVGERAFSILLFQDLSIIPLLAIVAGLIFVAAVYFFWRPLQKMGAPLALRRHLGGRGKGRYSSLATDELT